MHHQMKFFLRNIVSGSSKMTVWCQLIVFLERQDGTLLQSKCIIVCSSETCHIVQLVMQLRIFFMNSKGIYLIMLTQVSYVQFCHKTKWLPLPNVWNSRPYFNFLWMPAPKNSANSE